MFKATARGALLLERSGLDRGNAVSEFFWYVRVAVVHKNENPGSKDLNKFTNLRSGA